MAQRQRKRNLRLGGAVDVRHENALETSIESGTMDCVIGAFGLKTLSQNALSKFAREIWRILKPGGRFSLLEISTAEGWWLGSLYRWYVNSAIPVIGKICLGDIECYRMLGRYTGEFGSCDRIARGFDEVGFTVMAHRHFHGCATSLVGQKRA